MFTLPPGAFIECPCGARDEQWAPWDHSTESLAVGWADTRCPHDGTILDHHEESSADESVSRFAPRTSWVSDCLWCGRSRVGTR